VPVQRFKQVLGAVMLVAGGEQVEASVRELRVDILKLRLGALLVTALASIYLSGTITRPILRLAAATERVRRGQRRIGGAEAFRADAAIPDMRGRGDEIGELSGALVDMTTALRQRLDEIERFAADVAHEIRNPLTSLKSAVETAARVQDPARRERLIVLLDGVSNPHNFGAIARTAAFFGVARLILSDHPAQALPSDAACRVAEGGLDRLDLVRAPFPAALAAIGRSFRTVATALTPTARPLGEVPRDRPVALVFGNEERGLSPATLAACAHVACIPGSGGVQSLNVAAASAIAIHLFAAPPPR
jgi:tRNA G18 (ribose-2'-O)-methylase SpoU